MTSHADEAHRLLEQLAERDQGEDLQLLAQRAQAHALLALAEVVENWQPPVMEPDVEAENTREGWTWP